MILYYFHDCETSGLTNKHSVLKYYSCLTDENLNTLFTFGEYNLLPMDNLLIDIEALKINKIDLLQHACSAVTIETMFNQLNDMLYGTFSTGFFDINKQFLNAEIVLAGHNVHFDNDFILDKLNESFIRKSNVQLYATNELIGVRGIYNPKSYAKVLKNKANLDTAHIAQFLKLCGKLPKDLNVSLSELANYYKINNSQAHTAKGDVEMTIEVLKHMLKEVK